MKKNLHHLFFLLSICGYCAQAQPGWDKVPSNVAKGDGQSDQDPVRPFKDKDYDFGSSTNPSPRMGAASWPDPQGGLFVFGGNGYDQKYQWGVFADMWHYDPAANSWKPLTANSNVVQLASGPKEGDQVPPARTEAAAWTDNKGSLWLYGGRGQSELDRLGDMWRYDAGQNSWTTVNSSKQFNEKPVHGIQQQFNPVSTPGARSGSTTWTDKDGNLWLFGGVGYQPAGTGATTYYNDLWKFDTNTGQWSWVSGSEKPNQVSKTGPKNQEAKENAPSPRSGASCWFDEKTESLLLYGGYGYDAPANQLGGLSDLWSYSLKSRLWTAKSDIIKVDADDDVYTLTSPQNTPGYRMSAICWVEKGEFYMTGGHNLWGMDQTYMDRRVWKYNLADNIWQPVPSDKPAGIIGSGAGFKDGQGNTFVFGGQEYDPTLNQARPSNGVWKLTY